MKVYGSACVMLAGCSGGDDTDPVAEACPDPSAAEVVASGYPDGTEGLTIAPDGTLYATSREGFLDAIPVGGAPSHLLALGDPLGAAWWRGAVWVAVGDDDLGAPAPAVVAVTPEGVATRHPTPTIDAPNFVTPTPWGTLLVSDDSGDVTYEWRGEGDVIAWTDAVPSPNGMAFSADGAVLYVASTFREPGLWAVAIEGEAAGAVTRLATFEPAETPDGIAVGADGSVFVALNLASRVVRWSPDTATRAVVATPATPASLVFGRGERPACELVATSLFGEEVTSFGASTTGLFPAWAD